MTVVAPSTSRRREFAIIAVYVTAMVMNGIDVTVVGAALFTISGDFEVTTAAANLVETAFIASLAVVLPVAGWLADRFGDKRVFVSSLTVFTVSSVLCGASGSLGELVGWRIVQGAAGGMLLPVGMTILFRAFAPERRMKLSRYIIIPTALAPALGPPLGGLLTDHASWRWAFFINLPFGVLAVLVALRYLPKGERHEPGPLDRRGLLMVAPALAGLMYALGRGSERGWASWDIVLTGVAGAALLVVLIRHQFSIKEPLLDLRLWNDRHFSGASVVSFLTMGAFMGMLYVFPLLYQDALGGSAADSGLVVFPEALGLMVAGQLADRMEKWVGVRVTALLAFGCTVPIFTALAFTGPDTSPWLVRVLMFLVGVVLGVGVMVVQVTGFVSVDNARMGRAMSLYQVQRQLGSAVGVAVAASVVHTGVQADGGASQGAYRAALLVMSGALLLGFLAAVRWVREEKKETSVSP